MSDNKRSAFEAWRSHHVNHVTGHTPYAWDVFQAGWNAGHAQALEEIGAGGVGDVAPVRAPQTAERELEAMEREHFGDPEKGTGIYAALSSRPVQGGEPADGVELWHLVYGALVQDGKPDTYAECEKAAKRIANMLQRRALSSAPAREPMTDKQVYDLNWPADVGGFDDVREIVRQVERHHGICKE